MTHDDPYFHKTPARAHITFCWKERHRASCVMPDAGQGMSVISWLALVTSVPTPYPP
jgi:hypothetical protein